MMRLLAGLIGAMAFAAQPLAADEALAPGKPAGLAEAQINNHQLFIDITIGGTVATIAAGLLLLKKTKAAATSPVSTSAATATTS